MAEKGTRPLADLPHRVRDHTERFKDNWRQWRADVRENPGMLWHSGPARVLFLLLIGTGVLLAVWAVTSAVFPTGDNAEFAEPVQMATLYVACVNPACRDSYTTTQPLDFKDWPLTCRSCGQKTVYRARLCPKCRHWYANAPGQETGCPRCSTSEPEKPITPKVTKPKNPDDAEDPW